MRALFLWLLLVLFASACGSGDDGVRSEVTRGDAATTLAPPSSRPSTTVTSTTEPAPVVPPAPENAVEDLAEVVAACVPRADTPHPVFHGCIDWHSAVHGNYALRAAARLTGDDSYLAVAEEVVTAGSLDAERDALLGDLEAAGWVVRRYSVTGVGPTIDGRNGGGDRYYTDGEMAVGVLAAAAAAGRRAERLAPPVPIVIKQQFWAWIRPALAE